MPELTINEATCFFGGKPIDTCDCAACMLASVTKKRADSRNTRSGDDSMYDDDDDETDDDPFAGSERDDDADDGEGESETDGLVRDFIRMAVDVLKTAALENPIMRERETANHYADDLDDDYPIPQTINWEAERAAERSAVQNRQSSRNAACESSSAIRLSPAAQAMRDCED